MRRSESSAILQHVPGFAGLLCAITMVATIPAYIARGESPLLRGARQFVPLDAGASRFAIGDFVNDPKTLRYGSLDELIEEATGAPVFKTYVKYGDFEEYWKAAQSSFTGKGYEAVVAWEENQRLAKARDGHRLVLTSVEGERGHPADLLLLDGQSRVVARYQCKLGVEPALSALEDPKYAGMHILTTSESLDAIKSKLAYQEAKAARRGLPLAGQWERVKQALRSGTLVERLPSGAKPMSGAEAELHVSRPVRQNWFTLEKGVRGSRISDVQGIRFVLRVIGKTFIVVDYAGIAYLTYVDYERWQQGDMEGGYFAFKSSLRGAQAALTTWAIFAPDPTTVSKLIAAGTALVMVVVDVVSDPIYEASQLRTRELLGSLERDERYYHSRHEILQQMDLILTGKQMHRTL